MAARKGASLQPPPEPSLPPKFTKIRAVLDEQVSPGGFVNVIGLVKDCQLPIPTSGTDYKCTLTLCDLSTEDGEQHGLKFVIFRPEASMPQVAAGDVVLVTSARVQRYQANPLSLITNRTTSVRVYAASKIPHPPQSAQIALAPGVAPDKYTPGPQEHAYVACLYHKIDKSLIPDEQQFQERAAQSLNVKSKFSLLKDVQEGGFYDLVVQVATDPYVGLDMTSLYVSDYTENPHFYPHAWQGLSDSTLGGGDPYGYGYASPSTPPSNKQWVGPYGKMTIQLTCFEPHATVIRDEVRAGQWIALRNVQVKYGRDGRYLEGFLRGESNDADPTRVNVHVLETHDPETVDPKLKEAIRRCRDYTREKNKQIKAVKAAHAVGLKRKASRSEEPGKDHLNARERRRLARAAAEQKEKQNLINEELRLNVNDRIICEAHNGAYSTVESILEPTVYETTVDGENAALVLPFTCAKYTARVRVVDFFPPALQDFACSRVPTEFDVLSDNEDDSDCPSSSSEDEAAAGANRIWEWRFALQLEDPEPPPTSTRKNGGKTGQRPRLWVMVDNIEAQCLTGLDATDLRADDRALAQLRERMFTLWGDLEEHKARAAARERSRGEPDEKQGKSRRPPRPPLDSSDAEDNGEDGNIGEVVSNKPFTCCIRQYGIRVKDQEGGAKWVRCFGLFGTKICT
ncbi:e42c71ff-b66e-4a2f-9b96-fda8cc3d8f9f [Thermothielavioides terrestris]|uniref:Protection of telomeres protein 1 n=1 Tax=Thermothielavioides terrestris TaxID=2587410 RepID=A0A3S4BJQ1_9PEZI|nr:e42c71ff-b66e-4a2f-9b96-fda8cc3d8f9f [Thermothielavioides terrestris]